MGSNELNQPLSDSGKISEFVRGIFCFVNFEMGDGRRLDFGTMLGVEISL